MGRSPSRSLQLSWFFMVFTNLYPPRLDYLGFRVSTPQPPYSRGGGLFPRVWPTANTVFVRRGASAVPLRGVRQSRPPSPASSAILVTVSGVGRPRVFAVPPDSSAGPVRAVRRPGPNRSFCQSRAPSPVTGLPSLQSRPTGLTCQSRPPESSSGPGPGAKRAWRGSQQSLALSGAKSRV